MVVLAIVLAVLLAVGSGVLSAVRQYTISDHALTFAGFLFLSMPVFWLAALLKEFGAIRLNQLPRPARLHPAGRPSLVQSSRHGHLRASVKRSLRTP
jgi:peptide/nickel transport system permease protein